jgi:DNA-binding transcriptional MerR regulator
MSEAPVLDIGTVVERSGVPTTTLHVWEREGLLEPVGRAGLRRQYAADVLERIALIVVSQRCGFTLAEIRDLLAPDAFDEGKGRLEAKLEELRERRRELDAAIVGLEHALACTYPVPTECPRFVAGLAAVLPVDR